jgi:hypothetical protein
MLYFAYGSDTNWDQIRGRCPSTRFDSIARTEGDRLAFTRFSKNRQWRVADIVSSAGPRRYYGWDARVNSTSLHADEGFVAVGGNCGRRETYA